jgi:drug/metabolite transporter (DMT)-like permease
MTWQPDMAMTTGFGAASTAVAVGLASAGGFALSNAMQHRAAGMVPAAVQRALAVLAHLARQPLWLVATGISFCALLLHAVALQIGSIALVQPLMLAGVVLAVPARAALERKRPRWCDVRAVGVTALGLLAFILAASPQRSEGSPAIARVALFVLCSFVLGVSALRASRALGWGGDRLRAALLGAGAGVMFGATAGLLKYIGSAATSGGQLAVLLALGMLVSAGLLGTAMNQRAYQIAPIAFSMPLVNVVDIVVAVFFGAAVFGEMPGHTVGHVVAQLGAVGCIAVGLSLIAALRSDVDPAPAPAVVGQLR